MPDVGGGRVVIVVEGDTSGFAADLQRKVDAAMAGVHAAVDVTLDDTGLRAEARAAAAEASGDNVDFDAHLTNEQILAAESEALAKRAGGDVAFDASYRAGAAEKLKAETRVIAKVAEAGGANEVKFDAKMGIGNVLQQLAAASEGGAAAGFASVGTGIADVAQAGATSLPVLVGLSGIIGLLTAGVGALAGGLAPLAGGLAALPGIVGGGISIFGAFGLGLAGVGEAVKSLDQQQQTGAATTAQYAETQRAAAERVTQAEESLAATERNTAASTISADEAVKSSKQALANTVWQAARSRQDAARAVQQAEENLSRAEENSRLAEQSLADARRQAARELTDRAFAAQDAALAAEGAQLSLEQARQAYAAVLTDPNATLLQREQAQLAVKEAEQRLREANDSNRRAHQDNAKAQREGVDGNSAVEAATRAVTDAQNAVSDAVEATTRAREDERRNGVTSAQAVQAATQRLADAERSRRLQALNGEDALRSAHRSLTDAIRAQAQANASITTSSTAAHKAMDDLSPAGQRFARFIHSTIEGPIAQLRKDTQTALLPGLQAGISAVVRPGGLLSILDRGFVATGGVVGGLVTKLGNMTRQPFFQARMNGLIDANTRALRTGAGGVLSLVDAGIRLASAARPLVQDLARWFAHAAAEFDNLIKGGEQSGGLARFISTVRRTFHEVGQIVGGVGRGLLHVLEAAQPAGESLLKSLAGVAQRWADFTGSDAGQRRLRKFFDDAVPALRAMGRLISAVVNGLLSMNNNGALTDLFNTLTDALPTIAKIGGDLGGGFIGTLAGLATILGKLLAIPGIGPFLGVLFKLGGAVGALAMVAKWTGILKLAEAFGKLGGLAGIMTRLGTAATWVATTVLPMLGTALEFLAANPIVLIIAAVVALGFGLYELYKHSETFRHAVQVVFGWIKDHWPLLVGILTGGFGIAIMELIRHFGAVRQKVEDAWGWIKQHWPLLLAIITGPIGLAVLYISRHIDSIVGFFEGLPHRIARGLRSLNTTLVNLFIDAFNLILRGWNALDFGIHAHLPGWMGGAGFDIDDVIPDVPLIPRRERGGPAAAHKPHLVGEAGPELFIPDESGTVLPTDVLLALIDRATSAVNRARLGLSDEAGRHDAAVDRARAIIDRAARQHAMDVEAARHSEREQEAYSHIARAEGKAQRLGRVMRRERDRVLADVAAGRTPRLVRSGFVSEVGSGLAQVFHEGAIKVYNPHKEPASTSLLTRLRRVRTMGEAPTQTSPASWVPSTGQH